MTRGYGERSTLSGAAKYMQYAVVGMCFLFFEGRESERARQSRGGEVVGAGVRDFGFVFIR